MKPNSTLVQYYDQGWRVGYLVRRGHKLARIRRILPIGATPTKRGHLRPFITVAIVDTKAVR